MNYFPCFVGFNLPRFCYFVDIFASIFTEKTILQFSFYLCGNFFCFGDQNDVFKSVWECSFCFGKILSNLGNSFFINVLYFKVSKVLHTRGQFVLGFLFRWRLFITVLEYSILEVYLLNLSISSWFSVGRL